jgi:hypothetical protein
MHQLSNRSSFGSPTTNRCHREGEPIRRQSANLRAEPQSQPFNKSRESGDFLTGICTSQLDSEVAKRCVCVPDAEIPKEHLRVIDEDRHVHDFQITCTICSSLSEVSVSVRAVSQIATALAVRESVFVVIFDGDVHFSTASPCIYKTRTISIGWHPDCSRRVGIQNEPSAG